MSKINNNNNNNHMHVDEWASCPCRNEKDLRVDPQMSILRHNQGLDFEFYAWVSGCVEIPFEFWRAPCLHLYCYEFRLMTMMSLMTVDWFDWF